MFVANRYYNSPFIAGAAQNLGDALFGSPQTEYLRTQTEALRESLEDTRIERGRSRDRYGAEQRAANAFRGITPNLGAGEDDYQQFLDWWTANAPAFTAPGASVAPGVVGKPGAAPMAGAPSTVAPGVRGIPTTGTLAAALSASPSIPSLAGPAMPPIDDAKVTEQLAKLGIEVAPQAQPAAPVGQNIPLDALFQMYKVFTDQQAPRLTMQEPGQYLSDVMLAHGPATTLDMLEQMSASRNPNELAAVQAALAEISGERAGVRDAALEAQAQRNREALERLRGGFALEEAGVRAGGSGGDLITIEPPELEQALTEIESRAERAGLKLNDEQKQAILDRALQLYQITENFGEALRMTFAELDVREDGAWDWLGNAASVNTPADPLGLR